MTNGYKQYIKSREAASDESIRRSKELNQTIIQIHPMFSKKFFCFIHAQVGHFVFSLCLVT